MVIPISDGKEHTFLHLSASGISLVNFFKPVFGCMFDFQSPTDLYYF